LDLFIRLLIKKLESFILVRKQLISHAERVSFFAERLANKAVGANGMANTIHRAGILHDVGKLAIDAEILTKATKLTAEETDLIRKHPVFGSQMINNTPFLQQSMTLSSIITPSQIKV
jgi:HD-GYP domain-containing protein (c-di-GMP phosphodiesterase class II)